MEKELYWNVYVIIMLDNIYDLEYLLALRITGEPKLLLELDLYGCTVSHIGHRWEGKLENMN